MTNTKPQLYAIAMLAFTACSGEFSDADELVLGVATQAITGSHLVDANMAEENHIAATFTYQNERIGGPCTGVRITARTILTAAHCVWEAGPGDTFNLYSTLGGSSESPVAEVTVETVYLHPAFDVMSEFGPITAATYGYDVAIVEVTDSRGFNFLGNNASGSIPALSTRPDIDSSRVTDGQWARLVGYGCDESGNNGGRKQWADFQAYSRSSFPGGDFDFDGASLDHIPLAWDRLYSQNIISVTPGVHGCPGDSGGPLFQVSSAGWQVVGIGVGGTQTDNRTFFSRTANVKRWISNPERTDQYIDGRVGYLLSGHNAMCAGPESRADNAPVNQYFCDTQSQSTNHFLEWKLIAKSGGYFSLRNELTGKCLSTRHGEPAQYRCTGSNAQQWEPSEDSGGNIRLRNRHWDTCLWSNGTELAGDRLDLRECNNTFAYFHFHP